MQRIFERFRNEAEILATELNAEVEIVVKYSFKGKPEISSIFPNERRRWKITTRDVLDNKGSQKQNSQKPLIESSATYVQIRNPGSRPPPLSTENRKKIPEPKSRRSPAEPSSGQTLPRAFKSAAITNVIIPFSAAPIKDTQ
ncbi:hypothetical protein LOAG_04514 [Loa loa]|uniref:Uncharacterized protein n=1 Tax=Loa loa TaxID=7209 RepID=A0A1S0U1Z8_LOALO|nr:hypothetical protein LOAG_04514 [Loa loa]EFO23972.1 hypothetical protein LOAG_04514 [Loa loa]